MTNLNILIVVPFLQVVQAVAFVMWDQAGLEGMKVLEYLVLVVLPLPYLTYFSCTILHYIILYYI